MLADEKENEELQQYLDEKNYETASLGETSADELMCSIGIKDVLCFCVTVVVVVVFPLGHSCLISPSIIY